MGNVLVFLADFPKEKALVGEILIAYGELENSLVDLVDSIVDDDLDTALRALFRLRSEGQRLDVADAMVRKWLKEQGLEREYTKAFAAMQRCKSIRNNYAHCTWFAKGERLLFINLEDSAKCRDGPCMLQPLRVDLQLLQKQRGFFDYTEDALIHVAESYRRKLGRGDEGRGVSMPKAVQFPALHLK